MVRVEMRTQRAHSCLVLSKGETGIKEAASQHGLTVAEIKRRKEQFPLMRRRCSQELA
jgi:hypothetical protein